MQDCRPHRFISATSWNKIAGLEIAGRLRDWYSSKWWYEEQYQRMYGAEIDNGELDRAVACVAEVFNAQWAADTGLHPAHSLLLATGLYNLGTDLLALEGVRRLPSVIHDLKQPSHYESTRLEVELAALLRRHGYGVEFRPPLPDGRKSDILASSDQQLCLEAKYLSSSRSVYRQCLGHVFPR